MQTYGANTWIQYNTRLEQLQKSYQKNIEKLKKQMEEINFKRKEQQVRSEKIKLSFG
jgi:hypothetical protein